MSYLNRLEQEVCSWPNVTAHPHRFGGKEFRFGKAEIGHIHQNGTIDIPFPRTVRDALLEEGQVEEHRWVANSGWATYRIRGEADLSHAANLMRISYLRYALKAASDPHELLIRESEALHLSPRFVSLLERFAPCPA